MLFALLAGASGCASTVRGADVALTDANDISPTGADALDATTPHPMPTPTQGCTPAGCGPGLFCVHGYSTHDPPGPLPDGSPCMFGTPRYGRCWNVSDYCEALPPQCDAGPVCSCAAMGASGFGPTGCECESDGTINCYVIGI